MSFSWFIALRYLTARRKQAFISLISFVSVLGVAVGVMALIIATALMTGVQGEMRDRIVGATAHITVWKPPPSEGLLDVEAEAAKMQVDGVVAAAPGVVGLALMLHAGQAEPVQLKGIDPAREVQVTDLGTSMTSGRLEDLVVPPEPGPDQDPIDDPILLGADLAKRLRASVGDAVQVLTPEGILTPAGV